MPDRSKTRQGQLENYAFQWTFQVTSFLISRIFTAGASENLNSIRWILKGLSAKQSRDSPHSTFLQQLKYCFPFPGWAWNSMTSNDF